MITDLYDAHSEPLVSPEAFYGPQRHICDVCIVTFSSVILERVLRAFPCEKVAEISMCNGNVPLYTLTCRGRTIAFYLTGVGSALAATDIVDANWLTGATKFVMFGSAGSLDRAKTQGRYVVPTAAYRGEGLSYHYAAPADYIDVPGAETVARVLSEMNAPYVMGRVFTTDAIYRETRGQVEKRRAEGCLAVEMELAGVQAVCSFHGFELYDFLMTGDVLDQDSYTPDGLYEANHSLGKFDLALQIALQL